MKEKKRRTLPSKQLAAENAAITQFLFDVGKPVKGSKVPLQTVFLVYQEWRKKNKLKPSALTIDGFGRLFPHAYPRRSAYWAPVKHSLKCVFGLGLR
jgi:hypothetical protein